ncbi:MAG: acetoacetate--CoA ligase [Acidimicrobiales bacterium]
MAQTARLGEVLWEPEGGGRHSEMARFMAWLSPRAGREFETYDELWEWSVDDVGRFWGELWTYFGLGGPLASEEVLTAVAGGVDSARWFPGCRLNYCDFVASKTEGRLAVVAEDESGRRTSASYGELCALAGAVAEGLRQLGVGAGDRVAAVLTNGIPALAAFLASASLGAIFTACAPEFGTASMVDRFGQIDPKVLLVTDGYQYGGRRFSLKDKIAALRGALGVAATVVVPTLGETPDADPPVMSWEELCSRSAPLSPVRLDFDHPLWIVYSSGTTGPPKPIVHSHGGIVLEHMKALRLHLDLGVADRFFWYTTTGWMMWNFLVGGLLVGSTIVCYDGNPMWPRPSRLFDLAAQVEVSFLGVSAPYLEALRMQGYEPSATHSLDALRAIGSTGAPLPPEGFVFASHSIKQGAMVAPLSGGTDLCTAFLGPCPILPVRCGEMQCRMLGAKVEAYGHDGQPLKEGPGELVITEPMPSMPICLWGDTDGSRLHDSYFSHFAGAWRHGDWLEITSNSGCIISGRSDATVNRGGVRTGVADFYRVLERDRRVEDSLVVDTTGLWSQGRLYLFVVAAPGAPAPGELEGDLATSLRNELSPRHVPDEIFVVGKLPRTLNGKKLEVPARRILLGTQAQRALSPGAVDDPQALASFVELLEAIRERTAPEGP